MSLVQAHSNTCKKHQAAFEREELKILVVEDEKELLASIGEGLELDGYYVDLVDNGTHGS